MKKLPTCKIEEIVRINMNDNFELSIRETQYPFVNIADINYDDSELSYVDFAQAGKRFAESAQLVNLIDKFLVLTNKYDQNNPDHVLEMAILQGEAQESYKRATGVEYLFED